MIFTLAFLPSHPSNNVVVRVKKRRVGRPKKEPMIPKGVRSITAYFRSE